MQGNPAYMSKSVFTDEYRHLLSLLIDARKTSKLTQHEIAKRLNKPQSYISKYESGERRLDIIELLKITDALGADVIPIVKEIRSLVRQRR